MRFLLTTLLIFICFANIHAQEKPKDDNVQVITFGDEGEAKSKGKYKSMNLKLSPTAFVFGKFPIEFEKEINGHISLQAGIGFTFKTFSDTWGEVLAEFDDESFCESEQWQDDYCDDPYDFSIRNGKPGFLASVSPRVYWEGDGYEGSYIAPVFRYSTRNYEVQKVVEGSRFGERDPNSFEDESARNVDIVVHYGYQYVGEFLTWETFYGLGLRFQNRTIQDLGYDQFGNLANGVQDVSGNKIRYEAGLRVGYRF